MSLNVKPSPKTTIGKGFHTERKTIVNIIFCKITQGKDSNMNFINNL